MTALIIMLDLSAGFALIDHPILLKRLELSFWNQGQSVNLGKVVTGRHNSDKTSPDVGLPFGVPQGSVLGPKNYCMHAKPVGEIIKRFNITYYCYANDTQVYMTLK